MHAPLRGGTVKRGNMVIQRCTKNDNTLYYHIQFNYLNMIIGLESRTFQTKTRAEDGNSQAQKGETDPARTLNQMGEK